MRVWAFVNVALAALIIWLPAQLVAQDLPAILVSLQAAAQPGNFPEIQTNLPRTQWIFNGMVWLLASAMPVLAAARVVFTVGLAAWCAGWWALARAWGRQGAVVVSLAAAAWCGWGWVMGFANWMLAMAAGVWVLVLVVRPDWPSSRNWWLAAVLLAVTALGHIVAAAYYGWVLLLWGVADVPISRWKTLVLAVLPTLLVLAWAMQGVMSGGEVYFARGLVQEWQWGELPDRLRDFSGGTFLGYSDLTWLLTLLAPLAVLATLIRPEKPAAALRIARVVFVGGVVLYLIAPTHALGWAWVAQRFGVLPLLLPMALLVSIASVDRFIRPVVLAAVSLSLLGSIPVAMHEGQVADDAVSMFPAQPVGSTYAVLFERTDTIAAPWVNPDIGVAGYAMMNGGISPGMFATSPAMHITLYRDSLENLFPGARSYFQVFPECQATPDACDLTARQAAELVAIHALPFDTIVAVHPPIAFAEHLMGRGYAPIAPAAWQLRPATLSVRYTGEPLAGMVAQVALPSGEPLAQLEFTGAGQGESVAAFDRLPAGPFVLRVGSASQLLVEQAVHMIPGQETIFPVAAPQ